MVRTTTTKGERTRQRIVELAAPVFNRQGYVGASMRDLIGATGLEKGGIYNHFGSKEQLALEAYDYAMTRVTERPRPLAGRRHRRGRPAARMIRGVRRATPAGPRSRAGCPIMNTAIEADDTHPELRDRARASMTLWHRLVGRIVKDGMADGNARARRRPVRARVADHGFARGRADALAALRRSGAHGPRRRPSRRVTSSRCASRPCPEEVPR